MTKPNGSPPYADAHAAAFSDVDEKTYALIGEILRTVDESGATTYHLLVGQGVSRPIDEKYLPVYEFFSTPRAEHQAEEWLEWAGAPSDFLKFLVKLGFLARVDTRTSMTAAKSLRGLRLSPQSSPGEPTDDGWVAVISAESGRPGMYVCHELAAVLWGNDEGIDIPTIIKKIAKATGQERERAARKVVAMMPMLLEFGYARLEWLRVPNT
jgi:hypothetical protein